MFCPFGFDHVRSVDEENEAGYPIICECVPLTRAGEPCEAPTETNPSPLSCYAGYCADGSCHSWRPLGAACSEDEQCRSGLCHPERAVGLKHACAE
jgi:hypothetical protein